MILLQSMHAFYISSTAKDIVTLDMEESRHALKVLRLKVGDVVELMDGKGKVFKGEIIGDPKNICTVRILDVVEHLSANPNLLHLAIAPTKNMERMEWLCEKATEIGIASITPIICNRSERRELKTERLKKISISALKQSKQLFLPDIHEARSLSTLLRENTAEIKLIADCQINKISHLKNFIQPKKSVLILVGPEGDFTETEMKEAHQNGFISVSLGTHTLRTETAALFAVVTHALINT